MKIAIIGGGISGIASAYYLQKKHSVTLFEANDYLGGHTDTHTVQLHNRSINVDSGFIVFNEHNYPLFTQLLNELDVQSQHSDMSFAVDHKALNLVYGAEGFKRLFSQPQNMIRPSFYKMLFEIKRFDQEARELLSDSSNRETLGDYLTRCGYSNYLIDGHLLPMVSALWSMPLSDASAIPLRTILSFMDNHRMLQFTDRPQWLTVKGGSSSYVKQFQRLFNGKVHLSTPVHKIERKTGGVCLFFDGDRSEIFDQVIMACHSDQALKLLLDPSDDEIAILSAIQYEKNIATVHTDPRIMPRKQNAWASWNVVVEHSAQSKCQVTYWMNQLQSIDSDVPLLVSLNAEDCIDPTQKIAERTYSHPQFTQQAIDAQHCREHINGKRNTWFTGAYWGWGFHEDGVRSTTSVIASLT